MNPQRLFSNPDDLLDRVQDICPFPAAAERLMVLANDERSSIEAIAAVVAGDPALAAQVLRIANSAGFRRPGAERVGDLRRGLVAIGLEALRKMAGAMAVLAKFANADGLSLDLHARSALCGSIASALMSGASGSDRGTPFLCGLLGEVGALACLAVDGAGYLAIRTCTISVTGAWSVNVALAREEMEVLRYGVPARKIGARLLVRHGLPEDIAAAIEAGPRQSPQAPRLHRATAFARLATPVVVTAQGGVVLPDVSLQLRELARITSLSDMAASQLERTCLLAAASAEKSLRVVRAGR